MSYPAQVRTFHVLVVEDQPAHAYLLAEVFRSTAPHASLRIAGSAEEALAYIRTTDRPAIDLVTLDIILPKQDGLSVLEELRKDPQLSGVPVLVLSCSDKRQHVASTYALHANCFIPKPDSYTELREVVESAMRFWLGKAALPEPYDRAPESSPWGQA